MADSNKRNIPIKLGDFSVIDSEFSNIRERFDAEMRKMEDEMTRFRSELMNRESNFFKTTTSSSSSTTASSDGRTGGGEVRTWLDGLDSPLIQPDGADNKMLKLRFDVSQYAPEEIVVKTVDNKLMVHAKHEEKSDSKSVYREYNREFLLPKGTNPEDIKSSLSKDGVLTVEAPLPALGPGEARIPITQN
ncbi:alpha-crystallin B chain isoform X2 [Neocloeon triangulifer]|uniref:alpha-crystallin B chain isoform X2 n=1 Tax=Neocloeon triangulifer TaxID=2078957 RepID=UPI00286F58FB|nr:alpha-crystallin B chain isoform X2 [Neocloeon triangulifer]